MRLCARTISPISRPIATRLRAPASRLLAGRGLRRVLDTLTAHRLGLQLGDLLLDHALRHLERILAVQRVEQLLAYAIAGRIGELALHAGAHLGAQLGHAAVLDAKAAGEGLVDRRQARLLDPDQLEFELGLLPATLAAP